jgi:hypothetical protein
MEVTRFSVLSRKSHTLDLPVTQDQLDRYDRRDGMLQDVFPGLSPSEREFIKSGVTAEEWNGTFASGMTATESLEAIIDEFEAAIDTHIYDTDEEPPDAPERRLVVEARAALQMLRQPTIVIHVEGGCVQGVYCSVGADVELVDIDNMTDDDYEGAGGSVGALSSDECDEALERLTDGLRHVF